MPDWLITYLGSLQGGIVRTLAAELRAGGLGTAWLAFGLGALHALTPGHGKAALAAYFLGREAGVGKGVRIVAYGVVRLLAGLVFSLGLILVIVGGAELFTDNTLMVMACASGKVHVGEVLRAWGVVYLGNFMGAAGMAVLVYLSAGCAHGNGAVGLAALASADGKASLSGLQALVHGILANVLVCLAVWLCFSARTTTDKILAIVPPVAAFSAAGFEHSIANMYLLTFALLTKFAAPAVFWDAINRTPSTFPHLAMVASLTNLLWVTLGNMIGGMLVGITYWFIYLRKPLLSPQTSMRRQLPRYPWPTPSSPRKP